ncbi:Transposase, putative amino-end fragment [Saccharolobus solfataricus P2]|uniref:IS200 OrfA family protein n=2 Tax=Saccharolobus solfataricus TaxID=2287 RepID=A0A157T2P7_SACSO|nr:Transposase, putative amino-end fragment [Saccharolobus solfataricus P2]SAI85510.1 IS200 OrfA family protein [Saccharolobus solfataricus]
MPKYLRSTLVDEDVEYTKEILRSIAEELSCKIISLEVMPNHIHLFVNCPSRYVPSYLAKTTLRLLVTVQINMGTRGMG